MTLFRKLFGEFGEDRQKPESHVSSSFLLSLGGILVPCGYNRYRYLHYRIVYLVDTAYTYSVEFCTLRNPLCGYSRCIQFGYRYPVDTTGIVTGTFHTECTMWMQQVPTG